MNHPFNVLKMRTFLTIKNLLCIGICPWMSNVLNGTIFLSVIMSASVPIEINYDVIVK